MYQFKQLRLGLDLFFLPLTPLMFPELIGSSSGLLELCWVRVHCYLLGQSVQRGLSQEWIQGGVVGGASMYAQ